MDPVSLSRAVWRKSARSQPDGQNCVEVAALPGQIGVRDSKDPDGPKLTFAPAEWATFVDGVNASRYDLL